MSLKSTQPLYKVQQLSDGIQIVISSKKNFFRIILLFSGLAIWVYMTGGVVYITSLLIAALSNVLIWVVSFFLIFIFLFLIGLGAYIINSLLWQFVGKEIIIVEHGTFRISRQIFNRNKFTEYSIQNIKNLRSNTSQSIFFTPVKIFKDISGQNGIIAFDYGTKTVHFGFEIEELEAKQIVFILQANLSKSKAG